MRKLIFLSKIGVLSCIHCNVIAKIFAFAFVAVFFFLFFLPVVVFRRTGQSFLAYVSSFVSLRRTMIGLLSLATLTNVFVKAMFLL